MRNKITSVLLVWCLAMVFFSSRLYASKDMTQNRISTSYKVMTEARKTSATLILCSDISGKIVIHNWEDILVVELDKPFGKKIELGLEEGEYKIINIIRNEVHEWEIELKEGDSFELNADELTKTEEMYTTPLENTSTQSNREALLGEQIKMNFYGGIGAKSTRICGEQAMLIGGKIGLTFNESFSFGFAVYARAITGPGAFELDIDFDPGKPAYGGVVFEYSFTPRRKTHLRVGALFGSGDSWFRTFYIFEPGVEIVLNLSKIVRVGFGLSMPFTDKDNNGLKNPIFGVNFQFGQ